MAACGDTGGCAFDFVLSAAALSLTDGAAAVARPSAGGLACFVGTTRDATAAGAPVDALVFEAHEPLARAQLARVARAAAAASGGALRAVHVAHRVGRVGVGEAALVVWASAPHRAAAIDGVRAVVDGLKAEAAIWKKEVLADGSAAWKANSEAGCC